MDLRATPLVRSLRAGLLAVVVVAAGSLAHLSAAGVMPGWSSMLALYGVVAVGCAAFLGREASAPRLVALTVGGQMVVHGALSALAGHDVVPVAPTPPHGGMAHHESAVVIPTWITHAVDDLVSRPSMAAAHVGGAAAVGLWLRLGERALWDLVRLARCTATTLLSRALHALGLHPVVLLSVPRLAGIRAVAVDPVPLRPVWARGPALRGPPQTLLTH